MDFLGVNTDVGEGFYFIVTPDEGSGAFFSLTGVTPNTTDETFNAANWTLTPQDTQTTPEPSTLLGLLAVGSLGALTRKGKKG